MLSPECRQGRQRRFRIPPEEGYGPRLKDLIHEIPRSSFGEQDNPKTWYDLIPKGLKKKGSQHEIPATIVEVKDDTVTIDYNHPAAGHHLTYEITVLKIIRD